MQQILSAILSALVALHAVLGCCWHHAHCASPSKATVAVAPRVVEHCCHDDAAPARPRPHPADDCDEPSCMFVRGELCRALDVWGDALLATPAGDDVVATETLTRGCATPGPQDPFPPDVRLHLRLSVLLI